MNDFLSDGLLLRFPAMIPNELLLFAESAKPDSASFGRLVEVLGTVVFSLAVLHTFCVKLFSRWAHQYREGSIQENVLHFLAETEIVFGAWAALLFILIALMKISVHDAVQYIEGINYTEPKFVFVIMIVAATRPVVNLTESIVLSIARLLPLKESVSFYISALSVGSLFGSFITEPAAMTLLAVLLKRRYFDRDISKPLAYATIGLLFVNVSIGGTLTHFAAPPVLMVASTWKWGTWHMLSHFGWRAACSTLCSTLLVVLCFWKQLNAMEPEQSVPVRTPHWLTALHVCFLAMVVGFSHHPEVFFGVFMIFLGMVTATKEFQDPLKLREGLLVGFFLAGLVTLGKLQDYWVSPLIRSLESGQLYFGATALTAITDNAALTALGALVQDITPDRQYALVAGAVTGGGLTVIANAPNPAGAGLLQSAKSFGEGIHPIGLLLGATPATLIAIAFFWFV